METNAADLAYRTIKSKILSREYIPGFQIKEVQVSKKIGLTRTPVREAIIRLEREGLLRIVPNKGAYVVELSAKEIEDLYEVREALEIKAISLAIRRASRDETSKLSEMLNKTHQLYQKGAVKNYEDPEFDFHFELLKLSKNDKLISIWKILSTQLSMVRMTSSLTQSRYLNALEEHNALLKSIDSGDSTKAEKLLTKHINKSKTILIYQFNSVN